MKNKGRINFRRIVPIARKESLHIVRDIRSLAVVILIPIVMLLLYSYSLTFDIKKIDMGVVDYDRSAESRSLIQKFTAGGFFTVNKDTRNDMGASIEALQKNKVKVVLVIPEGFSKSIKSSNDVKVQLLADGSDANTSGVAVSYAGILVSEFSNGVTLEAVKKKGLKPQGFPRDRAGAEGLV